MKLELQWLGNELMSAVATGGAQGLAIIGLVWLALKCFPLVNAATRHAAWFATLIVVTLLPVVLFTNAVREKFAVEQPAEEPIAEAFVPEPAAYIAETPLIDDPVTETILTETSEPKGSPATWNWAITVPEKISVAFAIVWAVLAITRLAGLASQLWFLRKLKRHGAHAPEVLEEPFQAIVSIMGLARKPKLLISEHCPAPMVVGFLRPAMILPHFIAAQASSRQLEHLFRHEVAHLARHDDWTNLAQQIITAIFFFHPGVLFLSRRLTIEREIACDDHALAIGRAPREYALFLTEFASQMKGRDFTAAPAAWSRKSQLKERIGMILNGKRNASTRVSRVGVGAIAATALGLAGAALIATPRLTVAADKPPAEPIVALAPVATTEPQIAIAADAAVASLPPIAPIKVRAPDVNVNVDVRPVPPVRVAPAIPGGPRVVAAAPAPVPEPAPRPRYKPSPRGDDDDRDLERRLDRLERMVEELAQREKQPGKPNSSFNFKNVPQNEIEAHVRTEIERAHREADHARREVERAVRDQQRATQQQHAHAAAQAERSVKHAQNQSLRARKQSLEERRKQLEKELQAIEKEIEREEEAREKSEKAQEKEERKAREKSKEDADANNFKPKQ